MDGAIEWMTDFLPEEQALSLLGECDVVALPYVATPEGASGALRIALASGVTVAVSQAAIFDEAEGVVARIACDEPSDIAEGLSALLRDATRRRDFRMQAASWTAQRAWPLMKSAAQFLLGWLVDDGHGGLTTCPSMSPENGFYAPGADKWTMDSPAPIQAGPDGKYPIPEPGIKRQKEY